MKKKENDASPYGQARKAKKRESFKRELKSGLFEFAIELGFYVICFAIGIGFFTLCGVDPEDPELSVLIGMLLLVPVAIIIGVVVHKIKKRRTVFRDGSDNEQEK